MKHKRVRSIRRAIMCAVGLSLSPIAIQAQISSLSARLGVGTGDAEARIEFTIPEGSSETVLIRAAGPFLENFGVWTAIADPAIQLFQGGTELAANDDWGDANASALQNAFIQSGTFPFSADSKDSALLATLAPGTYTVRVYGMGGVTGVVLPELFLLGGGSFSGASVQGRSGSGENTFIGGFLVTPDATDVLVRVRALESHNLIS